MFPQNRSGKALYSAATLAAFLVISVLWYRSLPASELTLSPNADVSTLPQAHHDILGLQPLQPLPPQALVREVAAQLTIPKAQAAPAHIGTPVRLSIPSANIDASVTDLGLLPSGQMDAPKDGKTLGWYNLGPKPGQGGNSVIDGHLTTAEGPGAFWNLNHVKEGDVLSVTDDQGIVRQFIVRRTAVYPVNAAPMLEIFGSAPGNHLNLITCAGVWDTALDHYDKRLIVYTDLVE